MSKVVKTTLYHKKYTDFAVDKKKDALCGEAEYCKLDEGKIEQIRGDFLFAGGGPTMVACSHVIPLKIQTESGDTTDYYCVSYDKRLQKVEGDNLRNLSPIFLDTPKVLSVYDADGKERVVFLDKSGVIALDASGLKRIYDGVDPIGVFYHERIFAVKGDSLYFSAPQNFSNWEDDSDEGGHVNFACESGKIVDAIVWKEGIYLFFEKGLKRLSAKGSSRDFKVEEIPFDYAVEPRSVCIVDDKIVFLSEKGGYAFDGRKCEKLFDRECVAGTILSAVGHFGSIYYCYATGGQRGVYVYSLQRGRGYCVQGISIVCSFGGKLFMSYQGKLHQIGREGELVVGTPKFFVKDLDFGVAGEKTVRKMKIYGHGICRVVLSSDRGGHSYLLDLYEPAVIYPLLKGREYRLTITLLTDGRVDKIEAELSKTKGV